jgi:hypothetical protein
MLPHRLRQPRASLISDVRQNESQQKGIRDESGMRHNIRMHTPFHYDHLVRIDAN